MTITRVYLETELVSRCQGYLDAVGMAVTYDGTNADLNGPMGYAIRASGGVVANPSLVADADLSSFDAADFDQLADIAELRLLMNIKRRWGKVDITTGPRRENLSQFADQLDKDIENLTAGNASNYGIGAPTISVGVIDYNFAQTEDAEDK